MKKQRLLREVISLSVENLSLRNRAKALKHELRRVIKSTRNEIANHAN